MDLLKRGLDHAFFRSSHSKVLLRKGVLKICSKFTLEHPCRSAISMKLQSNFIEIPLRHGYSPENLLHIFRTPFQQNTSKWLLLFFLLWKNEPLGFRRVEKIKADKAAVKSELSHCGNSSIVILRPDKGNGVVILDRA